MFYVIVAILIFGFLIATHELGHFLAAKWAGVTVNEFSVGMGPAIFSRQKGETLYSIRILPLGGYCAMEGEDEDSGAPGSFVNATAWKRLIILAAGAGMNFVTGLLLIAILFSQAGGFYQGIFVDFIPGYGIEDCGLQPGDIFVRVNGHKIYTPDNVSIYLSRAGDTMDIEVLRDGEQVLLEDVCIPLQSRVDEEGKETLLRGITIGRTVLPATFSNRVRFTWYTALNFVRMTWMSIGDIIRGAVGIRDLSGPVGIVDMMSEVGSQAESVSIALLDLGYLAAIIAINLAVMNLLPLPALDGGRIFFLLLNGLYYLLLKKTIDPKYEGYVHMAGMMLLLSLMLVVTLSDVGKLIGR